MNGRVLVPYDGSEQSAIALSHAMASYDADALVVLYAISPYSGVVNDGEYVGDTITERRRHAETTLANALDRYDDGGDVETVISTGRPIHEILAAIEQHGIDHVTMGSHGRDGAARLLLGSVAETVVRRSPVPVTVARDGDGSRPPDSVLVPFDGSTAARHALAHAFDSFEDAAVTVLYVLQLASQLSTDPATQRGAPGARENWEQERDEHAREILDIALAVADDRDREIRTEAVDGNPPETIVEYVRTNDIDHVVTGSTGRDGVARLLLGSVAETVVRRSPVSVTVVK